MKNRITRAFQTNNKMSKLYKVRYLLLFFLVIFISCNSNEISCNSDMIESSILEILVEDADTENKYYSYSRNKKLELLDFYNEYSELTNIRTLSIQEDIKKCECQATMKFSIPSDLFYKLSSGEPEEFVISYSIQKIEEGVYKEVYMPENFEDHVYFYLDLVEQDKLASAQFEMQNMTEYRGRSDVYVKALKGFLIAEWERKKNSKFYNEFDIGKIYMAENELNIDDINGGFLSVYDLEHVYIRETNQSNIVITVTNSGGGAGGNVGIGESYLMTKDVSNNHNIFLAKTEIY